MGYELHITRAEEWLDSESTPISQDEWLRVATDAGLAVMGSLDLDGIGPQAIYAASAAANTSRAAAEASCRRRPMPTVCAPWPGKSHAVFTFLRLLGGAPRLAERGT